MIKHINISNFKSIKSLDINLGKVNIFIGENGSGKSNLLEAMAYFSSLKSKKVSAEDLSNKGVRVTHPFQTYNAFINHQDEKLIKIDAKCSFKNKETSYSLQIKSDADSDLISHWNIREMNSEKQYNDTLTAFLLNLDIDKITNDNKNADKFIKKIIFDDLLKKLDSNNSLKDENNYFENFCIYNICTPALRGSFQASNRLPLGVNGEGLNTFLQQLNEDEIKEIKSNTYLIPWLEDFLIDETNTLLSKISIGRTTSNLFIKDRNLQEGKNILSVESSNEGVLYILFYLALFCSKKTPSFFAIDNIESTLNPKLCKELIKTIVNLSKKNGKQTIITTHNPAVLDGINLNDEDQKIFVLTKGSDGETLCKQLEVKPDSGERRLKISEMWMRGIIGGIPDSF